MPGSFSRCYLVSVAAVKVQQFAHMPSHPEASLVQLLVETPSPSSTCSELPETALMASNSWTLRETSCLTFCFLPALPLLIWPQNTCTWSSLLLHLLAYCSVFLPWLPYNGDPEWEMLINPSVLDQTMACFLMTSSILCLVWPLSHVEKLPRKGQLLCAGCLAGDRSSLCWFWLGQS